MKTENVEFRKAKYSSRMFAFATDLLVMTIVTLLLVICCQLIVVNTDAYKKIENTLDTIQLRSHLYEEDNGDLIILSSYYGNPKTEDEYNTYNEKLNDALIAFYSDSFFFDQNDSKSGLYLYNTQRIPEGETHTDLFVYDEHMQVIPSLTADPKDLHTFYCRAISRDAVTYLMANDDYMNASRSVTLIFVFVELLIPMFIAALIFELLIPLLDCHGRRTLGKRIFKIGVVDSRGLSPTYKRLIGRFTLFFFLEVILSVITLFIPIIISFSMTAYRKDGQSFHDYVANTYVVDISQSYICKNPEEYQEKQKVKAPDAKRIKFN